MFKTIRGFRDTSDTHQVSLIKLDNEEAEEYFTEKKRPEILFMKGEIEGLEVIMILIIIGNIKFGRT